LATGQAWAQHASIGDRYADPVVLIAKESEDHPGLMNQAEALDLNGDGKSDAVYSGSNPDDPEGLVQFYMIIANDAGTMELRTDTLVLGSIPQTERGFRQIVPGDFNSDDRPDLFLESHGGEPDCGGGVECWTGGTNSLLLSNDAGQWVNVTDTNLPALSDFTHGSSVGDFNKDGYIDIWVNNLGGSPLYNPEFSYFLYNDGDGGFSVAADASNPYQTPIIGRNGILPEADGLGGFWSFAVDAEGDGDLDLGLGWSNPREQNIVLLNDDGGHFSWPEGESYPSPEGYLGDSIQHALVHDVNGDGLDDVLLHQSRSDFSQPMLQLLISNGDGTFSDETDSRYPADPVDHLGDFQLHDLDNDGHLDLFSNVNFAYTDIRINDGEGFFRPLANDWLTNLSWNWVVLDVDGDGGTDFLADEWYGITLHRMNAPFGPDLDGTEQNDRLIGGAHDNLFRGFGGNDVLDSGLGNDRLYGGPGNDELIGGRHDDAYVFEPGDLTGQDLVFDKEGHDTIEFEGFGLEQVSSVSQSGSGDLVFSFSSGLELTVQQHFANPDHAVELLKVGDCFYDITQDEGFTSAAIEAALGDCFMLGSLAGTVVDAGDGVTPVHPVAIDLANPDTGEWLAIGVENNPDGSYVLTDVLVGDYKVFFNAYGTANHYVDELYADTPCDNGACDVANEGSALTLASGVNVLNVGLTRQLALSGRVSNTSDASMVDVAVELRDDTGNPVGTPSYTDSNGEWVKGVPGPGTYYVRTLGESTPGYQPEVWNDVPCDDCDVTAGGVPIVVGALDVPGIDFELSRIVYPEYDCRARDLIYASDFEARTGGDIVITSNASAIFTAAGQQAEFTAQLLDEQGAPTDSSRLEWCLTNSRNLDLSSTGSSATIMTTGMDVQSSELLVRDPASGAEARALIVFAELRDNAFLLENDLFLEGGTPPTGETGTIILARTPFTETLEAGMIIASGDKLGILVRILSVIVLTDTVELLVEPVGLHEFYSSVKIESRSEPREYRLMTEADGTATLQRLDKRGNVTQDFTKLGFECDFDVISGSVAPRFDIKFQTGEFVYFEMDPLFDLIPVEWNLISYGRGNGTIGLDVEFTVGPSFNCKFVDFPAIPVAGYPVPPIVIGFGFKPEFGISGKITGGASLFKAPIPDIKVEKISWGAGLSWDNFNGLQTFWEPTAFAGDMKLVPRPGNAQEAEFQAQIKPYVGGSLQIGVLPRGPMFGLFSYEYGVPFTASINPPLDWRDRNYEGPSWKIERADEFKLDTDINTFLQDVLTKKLGGDYGTGLDLGIPLYKDSMTWFQSPNNPTLEVVCQPGICPVDPARSDYFAWTVNFPPEYRMGEGRAELVGWKDGASDAVMLGSDSQLFDGANGEWWPQQADEGTWNFRGMVWDRDLLNIGNFFPYPTVYNTAEYEVATSWTLSVLLAGAGKVTSAPGGIDCRWETYPQNCYKEYRDGTPITLTAHDVDGYEFIGWDSGASPGYACEGSDSKTCVLNISADTFARPLYRELPSYTVTVARQLASGAPTGGGLVTSGDGFIDCGGTCSAQFLAGTNVSLTATDTPGANFVKWADNSPVCAGSINRTCAFTVEFDTVARPVFTEDLDVTVQKVSINTGLSIPGGSITSSPAGIDCGDQCSGSFSSGGTVVLSASDAEGWNFRHWTAPAECASVEARESTSCEITLSSSNVANAMFEPDPVTITGMSFSSYTNFGEPCPQFPTSAITQVTATYTGTMENGGTIKSSAYWDNDGNGSIDGGGSSLFSMPEQVPVTRGSVSYGVGVCWGNSTVILWHGVQYISPTGVESNEVIRVVPRP